ncbi:hypothetical protein EGY07_18970 [Chryseobacterium indologenes]|nr:hypothetical protein [Chryseobacterium indologenes]AYZ37469.1 hypothetical protein EGY07_18970 [Chryseobacterium indologenes]MBF6646341.1 hypothetical protein [Chryseobacterium indologenes]MEB4761713.1 hypothetical protein [Chryseobacterium indologenes]QQQ69987.1 hypothetical protein JHW31_15930 [Chryseobacterium indologenes]
MVNQKLNFITLSLFSILLINCSEGTKPTNNSTFGFKNLNSSFDSKTNIFIRRYSYDDSIAIKVVLTKDERKKILHAFLENKFQKLPNKINCTSWGVSPKIYESIFLDNSIVEYTHNSNDKKWFCFGGEKFNKINAVMQNIILSKPEIKKLKPSEIAYE